MAIVQKFYDGIEDAINVEVSNREPNLDIVDVCLCNYNCKDISGCGGRKQYFSRDELDNVVRILGWIKDETEYLKLKNFIDCQLDDYRVFANNSRTEWSEDHFHFFDALFRDIASFEMEIEAPDDVEVSWFMPEKPWKWSDQSIVFTECGHEVVGCWMSACDVYPIIHYRSNQRYVPQPGDHRYDNETDGICPICKEG